MSLPPSPALSASSIPRPLRPVSSLHLTAQSTSSHRPCLHELHSSDAESHARTVRACRHKLDSFVVSGCNSGGGLDAASMLPTGLLTRGELMAKISSTRSRTNNGITARKKGGL